MPLGGQRLKPALRGARASRNAGSLENVGRAPWPAADPLVGLRVAQTAPPLTNSRTLGSGADAPLSSVFVRRRRMAQPSHPTPSPPAPTPDTSASSNIPSPDPW